MQQRNKKNEPKMQSQSSPTTSEPVHVEFSARHIHSLVRLTNMTNSILLILGGVLALASFVFGSAAVVSIYAILAGLFLLFVDFSRFDWNEKHLVFLKTFSGRALVYSYFSWSFLFEGMFMFGRILGFIWLASLIFYLFIGFVLPQVQFPNMPLFEYSIIEDNDYDKINKQPKINTSMPLSESIVDIGSPNKSNSDVGDSVDLTEMA